MPDSALVQAKSAEVLTGRLAEYTELLDVLAERPGLTVIWADPWSGTSALLAAAMDELEWGPAAGRCTDLCRRPRSRHAGRRCGGDAARARRRGLVDGRGATGEHGDDARELLGVLRAVRQDRPGLDLVLVEHPDGRAGSALGDTSHPLYRAGSLLRIGRPRPARFVEDLAVTRPWTTYGGDLIGAAAELVAGFLV